MGTTTALTAQNIIFLRLVQTGVKAAVNLTGAIYELNRPKDSVKEDIVVGTLAMNAEQVQEGVFNVNIHVPNLNLTNDSTQPNTTRFRVITNKCMEVLQNVTGFDYSFDVSTPGIPYRDGSNWFVNIRVNWISLRRKEN
jgi:hypothetical protein